MPLPLVPIAVYAATLGTAALASYRLARSIGPGRRDQRAEDALDDLPEGLTVRRAEDTAAATGRLKRTIRFGGDGPAIEIDASLLGRVTVRKV